MAWNMIAGATGEGNQQGPKLRIQFLEAENESLCAELRDLKLSRDNLLQSVSEQEGLRVSIQRELTKLKGNLKYEKTAREGSAKRSATYELECVSLREERDVLLTEQKINRRRVEELSSTLNQERLKRLRDLHLNEVLRKQNAALEESIKLVGADTVSAHEKLLDKVLIADSAVAKSEVQRKIIDSQANEILEVTREVTTATERYKTAQNKIGEMEIALAKKTKEVLDFEAEIWRLRKEVTVLAGGSHSQKHVAFGRSYEPHTSFSLPSRRSRNEDELRSLTQDIQTKFGPDAITASCSISSSGSVFGQEKSAVTKQSRRENDVPESSLSLLSASLMRNLPSRSSSGPRKAGSPVAAMESYSPGNSSVFTSATPFSPSRHNRGGTSDSADVGDFMTKNSESKASIFVPKDVGRRLDVRLVGGGIFSETCEDGNDTRGNSRCTKLSSRPKSIYVGQGLGFRTDEEPVFNPKGSAKLILKDILRQHELENG